ncbi:hypothetical protein [Pseudomonas sp. M30-35]|uniref:hypothetical protein n=1 Tax=Pseudomonas sp. M30-35 TaxID=1981174 RepID=UPI000B3CB8CE|nr:hypothetical protein [Pseudomonas sp. M30-35]ARU88649.1 hypothetical protein B9K09_12040 [Pseudomonas sp. M30-35]
MKTYLLRLGAALIVYVVVLVASLVMLAHHEHSALVLRVALTLAPMIPAGYMCWVIVDQLQHLDEMHLRIQFEALAFAFATSALLTFSYGFLENVGAPHLPWFWVWPIMGLMWIVGLLISTRRYQ